MGVDRPGPSSGPILRLQFDPPRTTADGVRTLVLDTSWTPDPRAGDETTAALRDIAARVLADRDLLAETAAAMDAWATASHVIPTMSIEGTSFWFHGRVRHGMWLHERLLWLALLDDQVRAVRPSAIECGPGCDVGLVSVAALIAARDGIPFRAEETADAHEASSGEAVEDALPPAPTSQRVTPGRPGLLGRLRRRVGTALRPSESVRRRRFVLGRVDRLARDPGRLLVVLAHARQRVETPAGPRFMNAYLGPIVERLRGTALEPIEIEIRSRLGDAASWEHFAAAGSERVLPADAIWTAPIADDPVAVRAKAEAVADSIARDAAPLIASGVDLGPAMTRRVTDQVRATHARNLQSVSRIRWLIGRMRPRILLLADEYHRQDWLTAARLEGVPTVAVQHGMISRSHNGYIHRDRPDELGLASRTYVFGDWERRLLVEQSVYRPDEVRVGGSPRLDVATPQATDREDVRAELGIASGDRLVVISGTWGPIYRRFHYPIALAALFDRPLPRVHIVVKLHPAEPDEGPYRAVIEGVAAARGFVPPPVSIVQSVDLYRLLRAADAHIGVQSTVLTEAVVTGTTNLLAATLAASDLLGYVEAGVAIPVRDGGDLLAALDAGPAAAAGPAARQAFLDDHIRPGSASQRIADDLLAWPA